MNFFIPEISPTELEAAYKRLCELATKYFKYNIFNTRIYSMKFTDQERDSIAVGEIFPEVDSIVMAIFEGPDEYYIFTQNHGVPFGEPPIVIDSQVVAAVEEFE